MTLERVTCEKCGGLIGRRLPTGAVQSTEKRRTFLLLEGVMTVTCGWHNGHTTCTHVNVVTAPAPAA